MLTSELEGVQEPFEMVHLKTVVPTFKLLIELVGELLLLKTPLPETIDHVPLPITGVFAARLVVVVQIFWLGPALEMLGL